MDKVCTYRIAVEDGVDEKACNAASPLQMTVVRADPAVTLLAVRADQSGLIGLLRHLHQQGYLLLSVTRDAQEELLERDHVYENDFNGLP